MKKTTLIAGATVLPAAGGFALGFNFGAKVIAALVLFAAWVATAQPDGPPPDGDFPPPGDGTNQPPPGPGGPGGPHRHPMPAIMKALDTNGDGVIDASEIANAAVALKTLDKNGDGQLTIDEYIGAFATNTPPQGAGNRRPPVPPLVKVLDANGDGIIDAKEIANASVALLKLDKNGDGQLTPDEIHPRGPGGRFAGGPPPGQDGPPPGEGPMDGPPTGDGTPPQE